LRFIFYCGDLPVVYTTKAGSLYVNSLVHAQRNPFPDVRIIFNRLCMQKISEDIILVISATLFILLIISFIIIFIILYQKRRQVYAKEKAELQSQFQQTLLQSQLEIQEQTLQNISQEIHDNIGQVLSLAKLNIGTIDIYQPEKANIKINDSRELLAKAIQDLRNLARSMNTTYIAEMGLLRSIEYEVEMVRKSGVFIPQLNVEGQTVKLNAQKELILFRIFQELINNIIKHAAAKKVDIRIVFTEELLNITVTDNGKGFDTTQLNNNENPSFGLGLRNMQNRARLIGAEFSITSIPETGTTVNIRLPLSV
jgi:two-component system NarL family sensor kinase